MLSVMIAQKTNVRDLKNQMRHCFKLNLNIKEG